MSRAVSLRGTGTRGSGTRGNDSARNSDASEGLLKPGSYFYQAHRPLNCLLFLAPLVILYEAGTQLFTTDPAHHTEQRIVAFQLMQRFFHLFGASGRYMPAMAVAGILLTWHIARKDPWRLDFWTALGMGAESVLLSLPLFILNALSVRFVQMHTGHGSLPALAVLSLGAGIYEELIFRLAGFTLLSILLVDILRIRKPWAILLMVAVSSFLFSAYHYLGPEPFAWRTFAFRAAAGIYFGLVFFTRGFGVTAGTHVAYDLLVVALGAASQP